MAPGTQLRHKRNQPGTLRAPGRGGAAARRTVASPAIRKLKVEAIIATLALTRIETLLRPYLGDYVPAPELVESLSTYLDLLVRWNARTNLTSIREPEQIVQRHFGESLFAGMALLPRLTASAELLDLGSGAGFPGLPIQMLVPSLRVTLAESQNKKATFLREVVRTLALPTEVCAARAEILAPARQFEAVTLRAVDDMEAALAAAQLLLRDGGWLAVLSTDRSEQATCIELPRPSSGWLLLSQRQEVAAKHSEEEAGPRV